eukprot:TRINITY_DN2010_c0_g1_i5.p2 TRINITY_DN2010_c0_g1~~TRINITY_DN2010_c0_g1_i5.p2  ORF type:complete len:479 (-),score=125.88 TRINITY_DN2010_c0_g1_i5:1863-3299(-)
MATVNIGNVQDEHYRYKMPKLQAKIEGRGNGIRTNIVNNVEIAKSLARPPLYLLKHFGVELGASTRFEENTGNSIVNGAHDVKKLCEVLDQFIKAYVQCGECGNPETTIHVKREVISLKCKACGAKTEVDMRHKLNSYIVKNPPPSEKKGKKGDSSKSSKDKDKDKDKDRKKKKSNSKKESNDENDGGHDENGTNAEAEPSGKVEKEKVSDKVHDAVEEVDDDEEEVDDDDGVEWKTDTSVAAVKARAQEQLSDVTRDMVTIGNVEAELEARKRKELKRQQEEIDAKKAQEAGSSSIKEEEEEGDEEEEDDDDEDEDEAIIKQLRKLIPSKPAPAIVKALNNLEMEGGMVHKMRVLYEAVFGDLPAGQMATTIAQRVELFTLFGGDAKGQAAQMVALEYCVGVSHPDKKSEIPHVLKVMYEEDIVDEEVMKQWYDNPSIAQKLLQVPSATGKEVRQAATVVIEQLVDDDDEDEEEEEE